MRTQLQQAEAELDVLIPSNGAAQALPSREEDGVGSVEGSLGFRILAILNANPGHKWEAPALAKELGDSVESNVIGSTLARLKEAGKVRKVERGVYASK